MCFHPLECNGCRLLHDVAQITGHREVAFAGGEDRLDVENVASHLGPGQSGYNTDHPLNIVFVVDEAGYAEDFFNISCRDLGFELFAESDILSAGTDDLGNLLVQRADARLTGVVSDNLFDHLGRQFQIFGWNAVSLELFGQQIFAGDLNLVFQNVSRDVDHLHTVAQSRIDVSNVVGRSDEQYL